MKKFKVFSLILITTSVLLIILPTQLFSQQVSWAVTAGGSFDNDRSYDVAIDNDGNVYSTGKISNGGKFGVGGSQVSITTNGFVDFFLAKYDSTGNLLWVFTEDGPGSATGTYINIDAVGNIFVAGKFNQTITFNEGTSSPVVLTSVSGTTDDIFVAKYNSNKEFQWAKQISGPADENFIGGASMDADNNIFLSGSFNTSLTAGTTTLNAVGSDDIFLIKLDSSGIFQWAISEGANQWDGAYGCSTDANNNVIISGSFQSSVTFGTGGSQTTLTSASGYDCFFAKYDSNGDFLWAKKIESALSNAFGKDICTDATGNVYVAGYFKKDILFTSTSSPVTFPNYLEKMFIAKFSSNGTYLWGKYSTGGGTRALRMTIDKNEDVLITGYSTNTAVFDSITITSSISNSSDIYFCKYDTAGNVIFIEQTQGGSGVSFSIDVDFYNNIIISGWWGAPTTTPITFGNNNDTITLNSTAWEDIFIAKYYHSNTLITDIIKPNNKKNYLSIFPNPSDGRFTITSKEEIKTVEIYNLTGALVKTITNYFSNINLTNQAKGMYFIKLITENSTTTKRIIID